MTAPILSPGLFPGLSSGEVVFLTGGTGMVGSHLALLLREEGHPVRALHRPGARVDLLRRIGCELVEGSLQDGPEAFARAMDGCAAIAHAAATIYTDLPWARVREVNVAGTNSVFEGARLAGIGRGVHLSSVAVYGDPKGPTDEESPIDTPLRPIERYARSKREGERVVRQAAEKGGMSVAILRPSAIYGERDRLFTPKLVRTLRFPVHFLLGSGDTPLPAIYAGNLADAMLAVLRHPLPIGVSTFNLADDHAVSQRDLLGALAEALGRPFRPVPLPGAMVLAGARVGEVLGLRVPDAEELPLMRAAFLAVHPSPFRSMRIREELGWHPPYSLEESIARTVAWARAELA